MFPVFVILMVFLVLLFISGLGLIMVSEEDIPGATLAIYNVVSADEGKLLKVKVSFIDGEGYSEGPLASDSTGAVLDAAPIVSHGTKLPGTLSITSIPNQLSAFGSIWSDGITLYGVEFFLLADRHIYAYTLSNKQPRFGLKSSVTLVADGI